MNFYTEASKVVGRLTVDMYRICRLLLVGGITGKDGGVGMKGVGDGGDECVMWASDHGYGRCGGLMG